MPYLTATILPSECDSMDCRRRPTSFFTCAGQVCGYCPAHAPSSVFYEEKWSGPLTLDEAVAWEVHRS
jgi:hypothetical protein